MKYIEMNCEEYARQLASAQPTPGGGGTSALVGVMGVALAQMVGSLTVGKQRYAQVEDDVRQWMAEAETLRAALLAQIDADAQVFAPLAAAYSLPKDTPEQVQHKEQVLEKALMDACSVPLEIMRLSARGIELAAKFAEYGSVMAVSDAGCAAACCAAALRSASLNVFINTGSMKNREQAALCDVEAHDLLDRYVPLAEKIFDDVTRRLV